MVSLGDVKRSAATLFAQGQHLAALRLYDAVVATAPLDYDARIRVAVCALAMRLAVATALARAEKATESFTEFPEQLHAIPLLSTLSEAAFRRVLGTLLLRRLPVGAHVIKEGEPGNSFFFVAGGELTVFATDGLGR